MKESSNIAVKPSSAAAQVRVNRVSPACWRVVLDNPPLNLMGPEFVLQFRRRSESSGFISPAMQSGTPR
jgi:hypothetical protein